jgi:hypothetical protein
MKKSLIQQRLNISVFIGDPSVMRLKKHKRLTGKGHGKRVSKQKPVWLKKVEKDHQERLEKIRQWEEWLESMGQTDREPGRAERNLDIYGQAPPIYDSESAAEPECHSSCVESDGHDSPS